MVSLLNLQYLKQCRAKLWDMANDPDECHFIIKALDEDPELREQLSDIYCRALNTQSAESALKD